MTPEDAQELYRRLAEATPAPRTELEYESPFTLLVAVVLSAQATDVSVNAATPALFAVAPTPAAMIELGEEGVRERIRTIGLFNAKAKNVILLSEALLRDHGGEVPADRDALQKLAGVGRKTANVVMNVAFEADAIAVDTHIFRVGNRTALAPGRDPLAVELALMKVTPPAYLRDAHNLLLLHGRYVCKARAPECWRCPIVDLCAYPDKRLEPPRAATGRAAR